MPSRLTLDAAGVVSSHQVSADLAGEVVMLGMKEDAHFSVDAAGAHSWELLQTARRLGDLVEALTEEYDVPAERCAADVRAFVEQMVGRGLAIRAADATRSFAMLARHEQWLAVCALGVLAGVRVALRLLAFRTVRSLVDRLGRAPRAAPDPPVARAVRRAVNRAVRTIPGSACLAQSITAEILLRRAGQSARLSIGVAPDGTPLDAHAWVECDGVLVTGDTTDLGRYRTLIVFGADARAGGAW